jgi:hypothetical protein
MGAVHDRPQTLRWVAFSATLVTALSVGGCTGSPAWYSMKMSETQEEAQRNNERMAKLQLGQTRQEVATLLGNPARSEAFRGKDGRAMEFLFYRTRGWTGSAWAAAYGGDKIADTDDQFTPLAFENGTLVGWGRAFYDQVRSGPSK